MEYLSFGPYLQKCRELRLSDDIVYRKSCICYGDGDGRFLARVVQVAPSMRVTAVDVSDAMLRRTRRRLPASAAVTLVEADALTYSPEKEGVMYDLVVSHFFLDCFTEDQLRQLVSHVNRATYPTAQWIVSDFAIPPGRLLRPFAKLLIRGMYEAFGWMTGLEPRRLPDHHAVLQESRWMLVDSRRLLRGLLVSELWEKRG
jgi:ubiquinone/menaquinone biosynthesis C-methylase UbiE